MHNYPAILRHILAGYTLPIHGYHGIVHWARVLENGLKVAESTGADTEIVKLFAILHDSRRMNENHDPQHGLRGGELARSLQGTLVHLDDDRMALLYKACRLHTDGYTEGDITLQTCWDADRLDLGRVGITPVKERLCTPAARQLIHWASDRAETEYMPLEVLKEWGVDLGEYPTM